MGEEVGTMQFLSSKGENKNFCKKKMRKTKKEKIKKYV
jgi:hypothetical protein